MTTKRWRIEVLHYSIRISVRWNDADVGRASATVASAPRPLYLDASGGNVEASELQRCCSLHSLQQRPLFHARSRHLSINLGILPPVLYCTNPAASASSKPLATGLLLSLASQTASLNHPSTEQNRRESERIVCQDAFNVAVRCPEYAHARPKPCPPRRPPPRVAAHANHLLCAVVKMDVCCFVMGSRTDGRAS